MRLINVSSNAKLMMSYILENPNKRVPKKLIVEGIKENPILQFVFSNRPMRKVNGIYTFENYYLDKALLRMLKVRGSLRSIDLYSFWFWVPTILQDGTLFRDKYPNCPAIISGPDRLIVSYGLEQVPGAMRQSSVCWLIVPTMVEAELSNIQSI